MIFFCYKANVAELSGWFFALELDFCYAIEIINAVIDGCDLYGLLFTMKEPQYQHPLLTVILTEFAA